MGVNYPEYNFEDAIRPCDETGKCTGKQCHLFSMCDLKRIKTPWQEPTLPKEYRKPKRQTHVIVHVPGSQFIEKQREIKRRQANSRG